MESLGLSVKSHSAFLGDFCSMRKKEGQYIGLDKQCMMRGTKGGLKDYCSQTEKGSTEEKSEF